MNLLFPSSKLLFIPRYCCFWCVYVRVCMCVCAQTSLHMDESAKNFLRNEYTSTGSTLTKSHITLGVKCFLIILQNIYLALEMGMF